MHQNPSFHLKTSELVVFLFMKGKLENTILQKLFKNKHIHYYFFFLFLFFKAFKLCVVEPGSLQ